MRKGGIGPTFSVLSEKPPPNRNTPDMEQVRSQSLLETNHYSEQQRMLERETRFGSVLFVILLAVCAGLGLLLWL